MDIYVTKRDGTSQPYAISKIKNAVKKAVLACKAEDISDETLDSLAASVDNTVRDMHAKGEAVTVEGIQDVVEQTLIAGNLAAVAKEYILYRARRNTARQMNTSLMKTLEDLTFKSSIECDTKRENANIDTDSAMGTMLKYGSETAKEFNSLFVMSPDIADAHARGYIHIHDLDFYTLTETCCQIDLAKLFEGGFSTGTGYIREPQSIQTAAALVCIAIQSNQNDMHGGQSIPKFDYDLAKYVSKTFITSFKDVLQTYLSFSAPADMLLRLPALLSSSLSTVNGNALSGFTKSEFIALLPAEINMTDEELSNAYDVALKKTKRQTYQAMEALVHNLNSMHSRAGAQVPFSSINLGTDTSAEGRIVTEELLNATYAGLGGGETPIFPISIFKIKKGVNFNPGDPNYDLFQLALKVSARRLFPNFSFIDAPFNLQYYKEGKPETEIAYMGCRTRVIGNVYSPDEEVVTGRGNLSFTSINLPCIAIESNHDVGAFFSRLDKMLNLVHRQLLERFKVQCQKKVYNYPFLMAQGGWRGSENLSYNDSVAEILKQGTLTIGFIGLAETLVALVGKHHGESEAAQALGLSIVQHMRDYTDMLSRETGLNWSVIGTPAEGLSGRFVRIDQKRYGIIPGVTDKEWYTNSFHVPVEFSITASKKLQIEGPYHQLTNGGHISYVELDGDPSCNLSAMEAVVRDMAEKGIGYGAINHPVDFDPACGYTGIIGDVCPKCGRHETEDAPFDRIRRITGYLVGSLNKFNNAKRAEVEHRCKHVQLRKD